MTNEEIKKMADDFSKHKGHQYAYFLPDWRGMKAFTPAADDERLLGYPHLTFIENGKIRFATLEESVAYCKETNCQAFFIQTLLAQEEP